MFESLKSWIESLFRQITVNTDYSAYVRTNPSLNDMTNYWVPQYGTDTWNHPGGGYSYGQGPSNIGKGNQYLIVTHLHMTATGGMPTSMDYYISNAGSAKVYGGISSLGSGYVLHNNASLPFPIVLAPGEAIAIGGYSTGACNAIINRWRYYSLPITLRGDTKVY